MLAGAGVLGPDAISGDPGALEALVGQLRTSAGHVEWIQGRVSDNGLGGSWSGTAADAFRVSLDALPGELEKLHSSFSVAADAIGGYAHVLAELQSRAQWLAQQIVDAESGLQSAQARHSTAQSELHAAQTRHVAASDPASKSLAQAAIDRASGAVAAAQAVQEEWAGRVSSLRSSASQNRGELDRAASACASGLAAAGNLGINNSFGSWIERLAGQMGPAIAALCGVMVTLERATAGTAREFIDGLAADLAHGGGDVKWLWSNTSWVRNADRLWTFLRGYDVSNLSTLATWSRRLDGWFGLNGTLSGIASKVGAPLEDLSKLPTWARRNPVGWALAPLFIGLDLHQDITSPQYPGDPVEQGMQDVSDVYTGVPFPPAWGVGYAIKGGMWVSDHFHSQLYSIMNLPDAERGAVFLWEHSGGVVVNGAQHVVSGLVHGGEAVGGAVVHGGEAVGGAIVHGGEAVGGAVVHGGEAVGGAVVHGGEAVGGALVHGGQDVIGGIAGFFSGL
jgi:hypothetical protein